MINKDVMNKLMDNGEIDMAEAVATISEFMDEIANSDTPDVTVATFLSKPPITIETKFTEDTQMTLEMNSAVCDAIVIIARKMLRIAEAEAQKYSESAKMLNDIIDN